MTDPDRRLTGYRRPYRRRLGVRAADLVARLLISVGGLGTLISVLLVGVFLVGVVAPLFLPPSVSGPHRAAGVAAAARPLHLAVDEEGRLAWTLLGDGTLTAFRLDTGQRLLHRRLFEAAALTAAAFPVRGEAAAFGFADGSVRLGKIGFRSRFLPATDVPAALAKLGAGEVAEHEGGLVARTPEGHLRSTTVAVELEPALAPVSPAPVRLLDLAAGPSGPVLVVLTADGRLRLETVEERRNLLTGEVDVELRGAALPLVPGARGLPDYLVVGGQGDTVYVAWRDGHLVRFDTRDLQEVRVAETRDLVAEQGVELTCLAPLAGRATLLAGDSRGRVRAWFRIKPGRAASPDGSVLVAAHAFPAGGAAAVTALASGTRTRLMAAAHADGRLRLYHVTSEARLAEVATARGKPFQAIALAPRENRLVGLVAGGLYAWDVEVEHPEASLAALFGPVWYEGYEKPDHVWQSSSGTDDFEPKLGLWPLVFGTLKATLYSVLFGVPIALLAALYTSEFLDRRTRAAIKPTVELMASLPSVVLGFLAGVVFAPLVERVVPAVLAGFVTVPATFLAGAYGWQMLPRSLTLRLERARFAFLCLALPLGVAAAAWLGPVVERGLFAGDIMAWLDGRIGDATGGWMMLCLPLAGAATAVLVSLRVNPWVRRWSRGWTRGRCALLDGGKFVLGAAAAVVLAYLACRMLGAVGLDPRGLYVDTYVQRNALVVGFVMGFAIIPIIYTLAEDALSGIPDPLRSASLGTGATPWQTAVRIVVPTAMSGLFSAVMIGLGRAVGETMIVLMAAGNTPVREWNVFNGFRTLSANIAVELPEAVRGSTHYRTLFLAALVLFALTFVLNTVAELARRRFRKRSHGL